MQNEVIVHAGRPTDYREEYCEMLVEHMRKGFSFESFAGLVGVTISTIYRWCQFNPKFSEAKKNGEAGSLYWWEKLAIDNMFCQSGEFAVNLNANLWSRNMAARFPRRWGNKSTVAIEGAIKTDVDKIRSGDLQASELAKIAREAAEFLEQTDEAIDVQAEEI